jgi:arabinose-5-phosphate isomerase
MDYISIAKEVFRVEAQSIQALSVALDKDFEYAVNSIVSSSGRVVVCGMGKSGIIGKKIAATMASTGTPSFFMHPGEAYHGDLGMVTSNDVFIAISNSGETDEVIKLIPFLKDNGNVLIAMTGNSESTLAVAADCHLDVGVAEEACPLQLAPTSSTTAALVMGDALAVTLMKARDFKPEHFARFHPGGSLGRRLLLKVENEMAIENLPILEPSAAIADVIGVMSRAGLGIAIVMNERKPHIITDGDLRRAIESYREALFTKTAADIMVEKPISVVVGTRVEDALILMDKHGVTSLLIMESDKVIGVFQK